MLAYVLVERVTITPTMVSPQANKREGTRPYTSAENWIKNLLSMALPIRARVLKWFGIPFSNGPNFSELSTMTHLSRVALHDMAHSFIEFDKSVIHVNCLGSFL